MCLESKGAKDKTFNINSGANNVVKAIILQNDGKVLMGGDFTLYNGIACNNILRLNTDGSIDSTFNYKGLGADNTVSAFALQPDNKILVGGSFKTYNGKVVNTIIRLNKDGTIDTTFNAPGSFAVGQVFSIIVQQDGKIIVGGFYGATNNSTASYLTRLNADGTIDGGFYYGANVANGVVRTMALQPDGKIIIGGDFAKYGSTGVGYITRINTNGSRDTTFNVSGTGADNSIYTIVLQPDGKILIGGLFTNYNNTNSKYIARLNANGIRDAGFNSNAVGADQYVYAIALLTNNKILIGGSLSKYNGTTVNYLTRLTAKGAKDSSFNINGSGANNIIYSIAPMQDNKTFYIGGNFTAFNGTGRNRIARLFTDSVLYTISGNIITATNLNIQNVSVIANSDTVIASGSYLLKEGNSKGITINLMKNNDINKTNGVTAVDIALVQSNILGKNMLNSPYKLIAADVNGDGKITALDIVFMKRLILGIDTTFTNNVTKQNRLWVFVDSSYKFTDSTNPFPFKDGISYNGLNTNQINQTFIGIKLGDVNRDWNPALARIPVETRQALSLQH